MLNLRLPFYGKRGTIAQIEEDDNNYIESLYGINGKIDTKKIYIKKNINTYEELTRLYYEQVLEYLDVMENKYKEIKNKERKSTFNKLIVNSILLSSIVIGIGPISISIISSSLVLWKIGIGTFIVGSAFATASLISLKNINEYKGDDEFINNYDKLVYDYEYYKNNKNTVKNMVKSRELNPSNHDNDLSISKKLVKK